MFEFGDFGIAFAVEAIHGFDEEEEDPSNNEELDDALNEFAIGNGGFVVKTEKVVNVDGEIVEIYAAGEQTDDRCDDIINERIDDSIESATDCDTNGEVDDGAAIDEFDKFFANVDVFHVPTMEKAFDLFTFGNVLIDFGFFHGYSFI